MVFVGVRGNDVIDARVAEPGDVACDLLPALGRARVYEHRSAVRQLDKLAVALPNVDEVDAGFPMARALVADDLVRDGEHLASLAASGGLLGVDD